MTLLFATTNQHKLEEVRAVLPSKFSLQSLADLGFTYDIPETGDTLEENALIKARFIHNKFGGNVFAEDTGLEIKALDNLPGVKTARFAGEDRDRHKNMDLAMSMLENKDDRSACFRAVIALILNGKEHLFEGVLNGTIGIEKRGEYGFGYDPIFIPEGYNKTAAELLPEEKNKISHRVRSLGNMLFYLDNI